MSKEKSAYDKLRVLYPQAHWVRLESWTGVGIFDANGCLHGVEVWIECKQATLPKTLRGLIRCKVRPAQVAWEYLRRRAGGRTWVALWLDSQLYLLPGYFLTELKRGVTLQWLKNQRRDPRELFLL